MVSIKNSAHFIVLKIILKYLSKLGYTPFIVDSLNNKNCAYEESNYLWGKELTYHQKLKLRL